MAGAIVISIAGRTVHDLAEFGGWSPDAPVTAFVIPAALFALWVAMPPVGAWALFGWAVLGLVGAALSVLPLPFWPFDPAQTAGHYAAHAVFVAGFVPLAVLAWRNARRPDPAGFLSTPRFEPRSRP